MTTYETLLIEIDSNVATLTINRPDKLNALNAQVIKDLSQALVEIEANKDIKALIITGAGEKAFVAGADIKELSTLNTQSGVELSKIGQSVFDQIENFSKPVIGLINGYALGGGSELALSCHMRIATENAIMGLPEVSLGLIPGYGGTQRMAALVGKGRAMEYILSGRQIKMDEAHKSGLVNHVYETKAYALEKSHKLLNKIVANGTLALSYAIKAVNASAPNKHGLEEEARLFGALCATNDFKEGTSAFLEKRKPEFTGT